MWALIPEWYLLIQFLLWYFVIFLSREVGWFFFVLRGWVIFFVPRGWVIFLSQEVGWFFFVLRGWVVYFCPERLDDFYCPERLGNFFGWYTFFLLYLWAKYELIWSNITAQTVTVGANLLVMAQTIPQNAQREFFFWPKVEFTKDI